MTAVAGGGLWGPLFGTLAIEVTFVVAVALLVVRGIRSPAWRRTFWQVALLGLGFVVVAEISGARRVALFATSRGGGTERSRKVHFQVSVNTEPNLDSFLARWEGGGAGARRSTVEAETRRLHQVWWPGWVWLLGFGVVASWMAVARLVFLVFVRRLPVRDDVLLGRVDALARRLGLGRRPVVSEISGLAGPIAFGIIRPHVSLPKEFARRFTRKQQDAMLAHELAHLAARDPLWHALADISVAVLWWHPLSWVVRHQLRTASESAADEASLLVEDGPAALADCLVALAGRLTRSRSPGWLGVEGGEFRSGLGRRVKCLVTLRGHSWRPLPRIGDWLVKTAGMPGLVALVLAATNWTQPQEARSETFGHAFKESLLGLALVAAMPVPQDTQPSAPAAISPAGPNLPLDVETIDWQPWSPTAVAEAREAGRPVLVSFTADWDITGQINETTSLNVPVVSAKVREIGAVALRGDYTWFDDAITAVLRSFGRDSVPLVLVYPADPLASPQVLWPSVTPQIVIAALEQAVALSARSQASDSSGAALAQDRNRVPRLLLEGKLLYEAGRLREAGAKWREALRLDAQNPAAKHYLALLQKGRPAGTVTNRTNAVSIEPGRARLNQKLDTIVLEDTPLYTRSFKIDPITIREGLRSLQFWPSGSSPLRPLLERGETKAVSSAMSDDPATLVNDTRKLLTAIGVDFSAPGKQLFLNDRSGTLMVRATLQELDIVEQAIQVLNTPAPQVTLDVKICEIPENAVRPLGFDWFPANGNPDFVHSNALRTGILTDPQYRVVLRALEKRGAVTIASMPKLTIESGRQAQLKTVQVRSNESQVSASRADEVAGTNAPAAAQPVVEPLEFGPTLDVVPYIRADGHTIHLTIIPAVKEFESDEPAAASLFSAEAPSVGSVGANPLFQITPRPAFRLRQAVTSTTVWDGQTVVLVVPSHGRAARQQTDPPLLGDLPYLGRLFRNDRDRPGKATFVIFITPTLTDRDGNRLHTPENPAQDVPPGGQK